MNEKDASTWFRYCDKCHQKTFYSSFVSAFCAEKIQAACPLCKLVEKINRKAAVFEFQQKWFRVCGHCFSCIPYLGKWARASAFRDLKKRLPCRHCKWSGKRAGERNPMFGRKHSGKTRRELSENKKVFWKRKRCQEAEQPNLLSAEQRKDQSPTEKEEAFHDGG